MNKQGKFAGRYVHFLRVLLGITHVMFLSIERPKLGGKDLWASLWHRKQKLPTPDYIDTWRKLDDEFELRKNG